MTFLQSPTGRAISTQDISTSHLYVPAFADANAEDLAPLSQQGMSIVQNAQYLTSPYAINTPRTFITPLNSVVEQILADPQSAKPFDLDAALQKLEAARQE